MRTGLRRSIAAVVIAGLAATAGWYLLPTPQKVRVLIRATDVASRVLRPVMFSAAYQPLFRRLKLLAEEGMGSGFDGPGPSGEANAVLRYRDWLKAAPSDRLIFIDAGAYEGEYTDVLLDVFKASSGAEIHLFEPAGAAFTVLKQKYSGNARVHLNRVALGDAPGSLTLRIDPSPMQNTLVPSLITNGDRTETVDVTTLDTYAAAQSIDRIDVLKLDIEGFEINALRGAARLLRDQRVRIVQFEFGSFALANDATFPEVVAALGPYQRLYRLVGDGLEPVEKAGFAYQTLLGGNYVAFLR